MNRTIYKTLLKRVISWECARLIGNGTLNIAVEKIQKRPIARVRTCKKNDPSCGPSRDGFWEGKGKGIRVGHIAPLPLAVFGSFPLGENTQSHP